jgi:AraC family transcriptional regulator, transcriptional activator of pobA
MPNTQSLDAFYANKFAKTPPLPPAGEGEFNVFRLGHYAGISHAMPYARYDFYKIMLIRGRHRCHYADKSIEFDGNTLLFFNPAVPYSFERLDVQSSGFFCLFKNSFFIESLRNGVHDLRVFEPRSKPVYHLTRPQDQQVAELFEKMLVEAGSNYRFRFDLLRNQVSELIHLAMKMQPDEQLYYHPDTNARLTSIFVKLLESQFPIQSQEQRVGMRSARDFAERLAVHVNHLNRAVRATTGKTTTAHIAERLAAEATALLKHTDWNVSEISDCLGFAQPAHFTYFFRKQTELRPSAFRLV